MRDEEKRNMGAKKKLITIIKKKERRQLAFLIERLL